MLVTTLLTVARKGVKKKRVNKIFCELAQTCPTTYCCGNGNSIGTHLLVAFPSLSRHIKTIKLSLYSRNYGEACNEWRSPFMQLNTSEETSQLWRAVGDTVSNLSGLGIKPNTYLAHSDKFNQSANRQQFR